MDVNKQNDVNRGSSSEMISQIPKKNKRICKQAVKSKKSVATLQKKKKKLYNMEKSDETGEPVTTAINKLCQESVTNVEEWLRKQQPQTSSASDDHTACKERIRGILEKLDTVVPEINKSTNWKFIKLFHDLQKCQDETKEKRTLLVSETTKKINQIYEELNERYAELHVEFSNEIERRAAEFIQEDY